MLSATAAADDVPGAGGDALRGTLDTDPALAQSSALAIDGLAVRGATPAEARILVDGFEVPFLYHFGFRTLGVANEQVVHVPVVVPIDRGRATSGVLELDTNTPFVGELGLSPFDVVASGWARFGTSRVSAAVRGNYWLLPTPTIRDRTLDIPVRNDSAIRFDRRWQRWNLAVVALLSQEYAGVSPGRDERDTNRTFGRVSTIGTYREGNWKGEVAASTLLYSRHYARDDVQHDDDREITFDARAFAERQIGWVAGLRAFTVRFGGDLDIARHDLDVAMPAQPRENAPQVGDADPLDTSHTFQGIVWTPDAGTWGELQGGLSRAITARVGLRVDAFGSDVAVQPRAMISGDLSKHTVVALDYGAYRRPTEDREELEHPELSPERATQVDAVAIHGLGTKTVVMGVVYYADRTHLVERGGDGVLRNSGRGTDFGAELRARGTRGPWSAQLAVSLSRSRREDTPAMLARPAEYDQPVKLDAIVGWTHGGWRIAARFEARSGLPYTPVQAAIYDSDRDIYEPILGRVYSERAPFHHQLDLRVDRVWRWSGRYSLDAYLDIANVYDNRSAASYVYSYDYTQKTALESLPILPTIGVRGTL